MRFVTDLKLEVAKREAGKKEVDIAQISEIIRIICDIVEEQPYVLKILANQGKKRAAYATKRKRAVKLRSSR